MTPSVGGAPHAWPWQEHDCLRRGAVDDPLVNNHPCLPSVGRAFAAGHMMARNLAERGYTLRGLHAFPDIPAQTARYKELGYTGVCGTWTSPPVASACF